MAQTLEQIKTYPGMEESMVQQALDDAVAIVKKTLRNLQINSSLPTVSADFMRKQKMWNGRQDFGQE